MDMKSHKIIVVLLSVMVFACMVLTGCALKNETLDSKVKQVVDSLNAQDEESFIGLLYPSQGYDTHAYYSLFIEYWKPINYEEVKLLNIKVSSNIESGKQIKTYEGIYQLPRDDQYNNLRIVYTETEDARGITDLYLGKFSTTTNSTSIMSWIIRGICFAFIVITIVDVIRKRPPKFGIYIVIALLFFSLRINNLSVMIPLGAISYWCARKAILKKKEETDHEG